MNNGTGQRLNSAVAIGNGGLPENRPETDLVVVNLKRNLPETLPSRSNEIDLPTGKPMKENPHHQNQLSELLTQTYTMLKKYGEAADTTAIREAGFQWVLGDYSIDHITQAFKEYLRTGKEIPTSADIVEILDPSVKSLCPKVY